MMRAGRDYLTKRIAAQDEPRGRRVKRGLPKHLTGPKNDPASKRQAPRKPSR